MKKILGILCITSSIFAMELDVVKSHRIEEVFVPDRLGSLELYYNNKGFSVYQDDKKHDIKKYHTDKMLRNINKKQLKGFLKGGYLSLNQMDDGEFSLQAKGRVNGGGPVLGFVAYWITKCLCYGTIGAAVGASIGGAKIGCSIGSSSKSSVPSSYPSINGAVTEMAKEGANLGLAYVASNAVVPMTTMSLSTAVSTMGTTGFVTTVSPTLLSTAPILGSYPGIGLVSASITGAGLAEPAALVTGTAIASTGSGLGIVAGIEALSLKVGLFFGMAPTL